MKGIRVFRRRLDEEGRLPLPPALLRLFSGEVRVLGSNPLVVLCPAEMRMEEAERHLFHLLVELRNRLNGAANYITH
ncbi:MAG: hypothetical protein DSO04_04005 [Hadesarchaea archaeon]|nr:MAG: hypothetical protein DSO04_04005 [Hadesarchaea archaeon]